MTSEVLFVSLVFTTPFADHDDYSDCHSLCIPDSTKKKKKERVSDFDFLSVLMWTLQ